MSHLFLYLSSALLLTGPLSAAEEEESFLPEYELSMNEEHTPKPLFSPMERDTFLPQVPKVNLITGEYCEESLDLVVAGSEPISIRRFYNHFSAPGEFFFGHWRVNPETLLFFNLEGNNRLVGIGEENSAFFFYDKNISGGLLFQPDRHKGFTSFSGQTNPLNTKIAYSKKVHWRSNYTPATPTCSWEGTIRDGSGRERIFITDKRKWPQEGEPWPTKTYYLDSERDFTREYPLTFSPPYQGHVHEERRPNGNVICYEYCPILDDTYPRDPDEPQQYAVKSIKAFSCTGTLLGSVTLGSNFYGNNFTKLKMMESATWTGSDGRQVVITHMGTKFRGIRGIRDAILAKVAAPGKPVQRYDYSLVKGKYKYDHLPALQLVIQDEGRFFETIYGKDKKVVQQNAPVGPKGEKCAIATYSYFPGATQILDGEGHKTLYRFNGDKRLTAIEKYQGDALYCVEKSEWDDQTGNLLSKKIEDSEGKICYERFYRYDKNHNVIEERIAGSYPLIRTYSDDGFNLLLTESDRPGKEICYKYIPGTNLLSSIFVKIKGDIVKRTFHFYDRPLGAICIKTIIDDGKSEDPEEIKNVHFRHVTENIPKKTVPCLGLIEEKREYAGEELLNRICYTYHPSGKVSSEEHYDAKDCYSHTLYYEYDATERLKATIDALGNRTDYTYDSNGNLISQSGPKENQYKEWSYDLANRPIEQREYLSDGKILSLSQKYDRNSQLTSVIDGSGFETRYKYDDLGRLIETIYPDGVAQRKEYDVLGNVVKETDCNGYPTEKKYNLRGQITKVKYPDGTAESFSYNQSGNLITHIDVHGITTTYTYDLLDHLVATTTGSSVISATYSPFSLLSERDALGEVTTLAYDLCGRKISEQKGQRKIGFVYDALGQLAEKQEGDVVTLFSYDKKGQLLQKKIEGYFAESYTYDAAGNKESTTTSEGTTFTFYNGRGQPTSLIDPLGNLTQFDYSYEGGLAHYVCDPRGITKRTFFDARERPILIETVDQGDRVIQKEERGYDGIGNQLYANEYLYEGSDCKGMVRREWTYGPNGCILSLLEAGEKETRYLYDECGRLTSTIKPDGDVIYREYDDFSRLAHYFGKGIDYTYCYDAKHRLREVRDEIAKTKLSYTYDIYDNIISEKLDSGITIVREYDPYNRCTKVTLPDCSVISYSYRGPYLYEIIRKDKNHIYAERNLAGKVERALLANGEELAYEWDPLMRWKGYKTPAFTTTYFYDEGGDLTSYLYCDEKESKSFSFKYDSLHQVIDEEEHSYSYDSLYNRRTKDGKEYEINDLLQVKCDADKEYQYDKNGNLLSDGISTYEYDLLDRLTSVTTKGKKTLYTYDALNRRLSKDKQLYIWDGQREIGMMEGGKIKELRVLGEGKGAEIGAAVLIELEDNCFIPIHDHCGSLVNLLTFDNRVVFQSTYSAFGEGELKGIVLPWGFASKRYDPETGFLYFGKRYYSPILGRFITPDPQGFQDGPNPYAYVSNNPLLFCDPLGLLARSFSEVHSTMDFCGWLWYCACSVVEFIGHDIIPVPGVRDLVESAGRFAKGGNFFQAREYAGIYPSSGVEIAGLTKTYHNGIKTSREAGEKQRDEISKANGGVQVVFLWEPSHGVICDLLIALGAKMGIKSSYEKMSAHYYQEILDKDPDHEFFVTAHSRGCTRLNNIGHLLGPSAKKLTVDAFGPATIIREGLFKDVTNYVSKLDCVPWTSTWSYLRGVAGFDANITFLSPKTMNPLTEHYLMGDTYKEQIYEIGGNFAKDYLR